MVNIPTELLRTLVAVVDLRSFTRAAQSMGVTQPAVSAQIKRLQALLDSELFDKSAPGVALTPSGRLIVNFARRLLSINDQIVRISAPRPEEQALRIGVSGEFAAPVLPRVLADFKRRYPDVRFSVRSDRFENMARDLREGELDLLIGVSEEGGLTDARHLWTEAMAWTRNPSFNPDGDAPLPIVITSETCAYHRAALAALNKAQRSFEIVFTGASVESVLAAVRSGLGIGVLPLRLASTPGLEAWTDAPMLPVSDVFCAVLVGANGDQAILYELADDLCEQLGQAHLRPKPLHALVS